jgi:basic membrane lipoprotein Med (substrate-binding protein (PBP1-ABC) superfamily)
LFALFSILVIASALSACGAQNAGDFQVGFVTDTGGIDDKSFNTTQWNGVVRAQEELGIQSKFIQSDEHSIRAEPDRICQPGYDR